MSNSAVKGGQSNAVEAEENNTAAFVAGMCDMFDNAPDLAADRA